MTIIGLCNQIARRHSSWWLIGLSGLLPAMLVLWLASLQNVEYATLQPLLAQTRGFVFFLSLWVASIVLTVVKRNQQSRARVQTLATVMGLGFVVDLLVVTITQLILLGLGTILLAHNVAFSWPVFWQFQLGLLPLIVAGQSIYWSIGIHNVRATTAAWWMVVCMLGPTLVLAIGRLMFDWPAWLRLLSVFSLVNAGYWQTWSQVGACWLSSIVTTVIAVMISVKWSHS